MKIIRRFKKWLDGNRVMGLKNELEELRKELTIVNGMNLGLKEAAEIVLHGKCPKCGYRLGDKVEK